LVHSLIKILYFNSREQNRVTLRLLPPIGIQFSINEIVLQHYELSATRNKTNLITYPHIIT